MLNAVKRISFLGNTNETFSLAGIGKAGAGIMLPHADNTIMGNKNDVGKKEFGNLVGFRHGWWQFNGLTVGIEGGLQFVFYKPMYLELTDKIAYSKFFNVPVYQGTADHSLWMNEIVLSVGVAVNGTVTSQTL